MPSDAHSHWKEWKSVCLKPIRKKSSANGSSGKSPFHQSDHLNLLPGTHIVEGKNQLLVSCSLISTLLPPTQINSRCKSVKHEEVELRNVRLCKRRGTFRPKIWPQHFIQHDIQLAAAADWSPPVQMKTTSCSCQISVYSLQGHSWAGFLHASHQYCLNYEFHDNLVKKAKSCFLKWSPKLLLVRRVQLSEGCEKCHHATWRKVGRAGIWVKYEDSEWTLCVSLMSGVKTKKEDSRDRIMAWQLRALAAFSEDLGLSPITYLGSCLSLLYNTPNAVISPANAKHKQRWQLHPGINMHMVQGETTGTEGKNRVSLASSRFIIREIKLP